MDDDAHPIEGQEPEATRRGWKATTVRFQLLVVVNSLLAVFVACYLVADYHRDLSERLREKRIALEEEAKTLLPAVSQLRRQNDGIQKYIDTVCKRMQESQSPGHHIAVEVGQESYQATTHHRASPAILSAMRKATTTNGQARVGGSNLVVGTHKQDDAVVYVSETMSSLYRSAVGDALRRLASFVALCIIAGIAVNFALIHIVTRPLNELVATVRSIGSGKLGVQAAALNSMELNFVAAEVNSMSAALADADNTRRLQMSKAREIQHNLLPQDVQIPGIRVAHFFEPAEDVGGDYYDAMQLDDGTWIVCVADVTGHGVPAALCAAMLKTLLMQATVQFNSPAAMLNFINRRFATVSLIGDFVSMAIVHVWPDSCKAVYASAGHEPALLVAKNGDVEELPSTGLLLGIDDEAEWEEISLSLNPGQRLYIVTDGVSETENAVGEMFGRSRLASLVSECRALEPDDAVEQFALRLSDFRGEMPQHDDVTVVLVGFHAD